MSASNQPDRPTGAESSAARLAAERAATESLLAGLNRQFDDMTAASLNSNADDEHDPEGSTIAFERSQIDASISQAEHHLAELDDAEKRLADGSYGRCESCGQTIDAARLEARPTARTCISCASQNR